MAARRVSNSGCEAATRAGGAIAAIPITGRLQAGEGVNRTAHELRDGDVVAPRPAPERLQLVICQLNLCPDHAIMITLLMA